MKDITIRIPNFGSHVGTLGWLSDTLANTELKVLALKDGTPALFAVFPPTATQNGKAIKHLLVKPSQLANINHERYEGKYDKDANQWFAVAHLQEDDMCPGLFGPLTPAARERAQEWREGCFRQFAAAWAADGQDAK